MSAGIDSSVRELEVLLRACGQEAKASEVEAIRLRLRGPDAATGRRMLQEQLAGGMGSLLDTGLRDSADGQMTAAEADARLWDLVERIDQLLGDAT